jgi:hypothetical protein
MALRPRCSSYLYGAVVAHARVTVPGAEALKLLGTDLVDVELAELGIIIRLHRHVQGRHK